MEQSITKFCKCSRKRDSEKVRQDINEEVYMATKKYHQVSFLFCDSIIRNGSFWSVTRL